MGDFISRLIAAFVVYFAVLLVVYGLIMLIIKFAALAALAGLIALVYAVAKIWL